MSSLPIILGSIVLFILAYIFYGRWLEKKMGIDPSKLTPCHTMCDGVDYVPCKPTILLSHHFASIAGAAPIIGPIVASVFGWLPVLLWIVIGGIFAGAVHDFTSLVASLRHRGRSIGVVIEEHVGFSGKVFFMIFALATLILVVGAFLVVVARTFVGQPAVATSSLLFIFLALIFGQMLYRFKMPVLPATIIGIIGLILCIWLGMKFPFPLYSEHVADLKAAQLHAEHTWVWVMLVYIFIASVLPVNLLLQPRDYLNSFLLYAIIVASLVGLLIVHPKIQIAPIETLRDPNTGGFIFPLLFVTVACGAISGFHSLVSSGTTVKQLDNERHARPVSYGSMLIESVLAVIALVVVATLTKSQAVNAQIDPVGTFSNGVGAILNKLGMNHQVAVTFTALAVSAFALTSLDTATRIGRFVFQELFTGRGAAAGQPTNGLQKVLTNRYLAAMFMVVCGGYLALSGKWFFIWKLFGSANQLMAAIALLAVAVWLARKHVSSWFIQIPLYFMFAVTLSALVILCIQNIKAGNRDLAGLSIFLLVVAIVLAVETIRALIRIKASGEPVPESLKI